MIQRLLDWLGRRQVEKHHVVDTLRAVDARMDRAAALVQEEASEAGIRIALHYRDVNRATFGRWPYEDRRKGGRP